MEQVFSLLASFPLPRELTIDDQDLDRAIKEYISALNLNQARLKDAVLSKHARALEVCFDSSNAVFNALIEM